jgi:hypothetical protein
MYKTTSFFSVRYLYYLLFSFLFFACQSEEPVPADGPMFTLLSPEETGVTFNNIIQEEPQIYNHLKWAAVYQGAGLAVGDINNDDLPDLFFAGNIVNDALYLNTGDLQFEEITDQARIARDKGWSTGVTMADVNQDGYLDIYVCRFGWSSSPDDKRNLLYINNQDNTFTEQGAQYGVNDGGFSTQATFFDMDKDGDLDLYVANQPPDSRLISRYQIDLAAIREGISDRLYRNDGTHFTDVTKAAGIFNQAYGLNAIASDLNGDGWTDIYVSNDYEEPDMMYINNKNGTFTNTIQQAVKHISFYAMGSDVADFNNDGLPDIGVVDMAAEDHFRSKTNMGSMRPATFWNNIARGKHYQYMFNTLQVNNGNGSFSDIGQLAGMSKTDWSWAILFADLDNDGWKDITITNGIKKDIRNNDFLGNIRKQVEAGNTEFQVMDLVNMLPSNPVPNYIYQNNGDYTFSNKAQEWGVSEPGFSNGASFADLDGDGDLELIFNNVDSPASIYENRRGRANRYIRFKLEGDARNTFALNAKVRIEYEGLQQVQELTLTRGYLSSSEPILHFGTGSAEKVEKAIITWPDGQETVMNDLSTNRVYEVRYQKAEKEMAKQAAPPQPLLQEITPETGLAITHQENDFDEFEREILLPHKQSENGPYMATGDVNGDGLEDFYLGGAMGFAGALYLQNADGTFAASPQDAFAKDQAFEDLGSLLFDADGDNDLDLYVVSGGTEHQPGSANYQDRIYRNDGPGNFTRANVLPTFYESGQIVKANDFDGDGDLDLFVGGRAVPGKYPAPANSYLLQNDNGTFSDVTADYAPMLRALGLVTDALFSDYDQDGDDDLLIVGEWMSIRVLNNENGRFSEKSADLGLSYTEGWWWSIEQGDFDGDGDPDYIVGNLGRNKKFKASKEKPFMVYQKDFDENGSNDVVLASFSGDKPVPVRGRECSSEQMPFIAEKFPTYQEFASASLDQIYTAEALENANQREVHTFKSAFLRNDGTTFTKTELPVEAQFAPVKDIAVLDVNNDGNLDALLVGNHYGAEVETIRYDAGIGVCLLGDGKGSFAPAPVKESGFFTRHDARSICRMEGKGAPLLVVGNNQGPLQVFRIP